MKRILIALMLASLSGCAVVDSVQKYWPRSHDPVMFDRLVVINTDIANINCEAEDWRPEWANVQRQSKLLADYTEWRNDPQQENLRGLYNHTVRMSKGGSKMFCELGKRTALSRIQAARSAWGGR